MGKKFLQQQAVHDKQLVDASEATTMQFMLDTMQILLHRELGWGYKRIIDLSEKWGALHDEFYPCFNTRNPEADVLRQHLDDNLREIAAGNAEVTEFEERYQYVKEIRYGK